jgi:hypothetical protein
VIVKANKGIFANWFLSLVELELKKLKKKGGTVGAVRTADSQSILRSLSCSPKLRSARKEILVLKKHARSLPAMLGMDFLNDGQAIGSIPERSGWIEHLWLDYGRSAKERIGSRRNADDLIDKRIVSPGSWNFQRLNIWLIGSSPSFD